MRPTLRGWLLAALVLGFTAGWLGYATQRPVFADNQSRETRPAPAHDLDDTPDVDKKIVPILTFGSNLNVGAAQVSGPADKVRDVKAVAQLETDYKDWARIKILVPVHSEDVVRRIERVPGVSITAIADVRLSD
ncbi:MAG: hypothetical protein HY320_14880 [Armatimonadetes bacterium]|nr:hypothetical protein [Armatimonadota bacterium]